MRKRFQFLLIGSSLLVFLPAGLASQHPASPNPSGPQATAQSTTTQASKSEPKRVWTNDNISQVRTPEDVYQDQQRAAEEAARRKKKNTAAQAQHKTRQHAGHGPVVLKLPKTVSGAEQAIAQRQSMFDNFNNLLDTTQKQLNSETNPTVRVTLQQKAGLLRGYVANTQADLKKLQKRLAELEAKEKAKRK